MTSDPWHELDATADAAFRTAALHAGLVDVAVATLDTPLGALLLAAVDGAIVRVAYDVEDHHVVLEDLARDLSPRLLLADVPVLAAARSQLEEYFTGARTAIDVPVDLRLARGAFRREVLALLPTIPPGETRTYAQLAAAAGRPRAVRAVGSGCATNPVPLLVPCHRVLRTGGALGGYLGGVDRKRWLLDHERRLAS